MIIGRRQGSTRDNNKGGKVRNIAYLLEENVQFYFLKAKETKFNSFFASRRERYCFFFFLQLMKQHEIHKNQPYVRQPCAVFAYCQQNRDLPFSKRNKFFFFN